MLRRRSKNTHQNLAARELGGGHASKLSIDWSRDRYCQKDVRFHTRSVNSVEFSGDETLLATGGDDKRVVVWNVGQLINDRTPRPIVVMKNNQIGYIHTQTFSNDLKFLFSAGDDGIVMKYDLNTGGLLSYNHAEPQNEFFDLEQCPENNSILAFARRDRVGFCDGRCSNQAVLRFSGCHEGRRYGPFYSVKFNPANPNLVLTASAKNAPMVFDVRKPGRAYLHIKNKPPKRCVLPPSYVGTTSAVWNSTATGIATIFQSNAPSYYDLDLKLCFNFADQDFHSNTFNSYITMINDKYILSGSDDSGIFMWKIPDWDFTEKEESIKTPGGFEKFPEVFRYGALRRFGGHRGIPSKVRYSEKNRLLISTGTEYSFKLWSTLPMPYSYIMPFMRYPKRQFSPDPFLRQERERYYREEFEDRIGSENDGKATWDDVFGGKSSTAESRTMCEYFDHLVGKPIPDHPVKPPFNPYCNGGEAMAFLGPPRQDIDGSRYHAYSVVNALRVIQVYEDAKRYLYPNNRRN